MEMNQRVLNALFAPMIPGIIFVIAFIQTETAGTVFFGLIGCLVSTHAVYHLWRFPPNITVEEQNSCWREPPEYGVSIEES